MTVTLAVHQECKTKVTYPAGAKTTTQVLYTFDGSSQYDPASIASSIQSNLVGVLTADQSQITKGLSAVSTNIKQTFLTLYPPFQVLSALLGGQDYVHPLLPLECPNNLETLNF